MSKKIIIGKSESGAKVGFDLATLITTRLLIQANSGAGKSYLLRKLMEELFGFIQIICIDPEGEFSTLREKYGFVLVGKGGETPADTRTAAAVAEKLLELKASAICDLYEMKAAERHVWVKNFLDAMIDAPKKLWHPVMVIVDEAQLFCPEQKIGGDSVAKASMIDLTTRGRKRGYCPVWATQRLAKVDKDATSSLLNRLVGGTFEDVDIKRALDLLSVASEDKKAVAQQLRTMDPGFFFAFGRAVSKERLLFRVSEVQTSHPQPGSAKHAAEPPPLPDKIKELLPKLADLPKEAAEKAKNEAELRAVVQRLERELRDVKRAAPVVPAVPVVKGISQGELERQVKTAAATASAQTKKELEEKAELIVGEIQAAFNEAALRLKAAQNMLPNVRGVFRGFKAPAPVLPRTIEAVTPVHSPPTRPSSLPPPSRRVSLPPLDGAASNGQQLNSTARKLLGILAQWSPEGMSRAQLAAFAGIKSNTGSFGNRMSELRVPGYIREEGDRIFATDAGIEAAGVDIQPAPRTTDEVLAIWRGKLNSTAFRMLEILAAEGGRAIARAELAERAGVQPNTGSFGNRLSELRSARLLVDQGGAVAANPETTFV